MKATTTTLEDGAPSLRRSADFVARHPALTPGPSPDSCLAGEGRSSSASSRLLFGRSPWRLPRLATRWVAMACAVALLGLFAFDARNARSALAEGEAGVVIQHGDGSTETFCVAFTGDSISGDQLLKRAGVAQENVNGLVCSVGQRADEGCYGAGTFESCTCKCKNPGAGCAYWAFYTQRYGQQWVYSALGFLAQRAKDGEMQAWRWGLGGANSAPAPAAIRRRRTPWRSQQSHRPPQPRLPPGSRSRRQRAWRVRHPSAKLAPLSPMSSSTRLCLPSPLHRRLRQRRMSADRRTTAAGAEPSCSGSLLAGWGR